MPEASSSVLKVPGRKKREKVEALRAEMETMRKEHQVREARMKVALPTYYYYMYVVFVTCYMLLSA